MKDCFFDFDYDWNGYTPCNDCETCDECAWYTDVMDGEEVGNEETEGTVEQDVVRSEQCREHR